MSNAIATQTEANECYWAYIELVSAAYFLYATVFTVPYHGLRLEYSYWTVRRRIGEL